MTSTCSLAFNPLFSSTKRENSFLTSSIKHCSFRYLFSFLTHTPKASSLSLVCFFLWEHRGNIREHGLGKIDSLRLRQSIQTV